MSHFIVSARKYRPTSFDEVVGQDHIAKTLKNALQTDHLAHAFLFTGPRGVGKTTCARILAKIINCENPINKVEACNQCQSCKAFNDNASFNILELDAASNNSVENIRTLIEQVRFQPQNGKYKVFIIDEVHMLSTAAFNAFLKTLEEPPAYAIFILATTEKHKIIPTILSRCQIFDFKRIQIGDTVDQLLKICKKEGIQADNEALHTIAIKADGAMRDALTIFDKITSATDGNITYKDVVANLNLLDYEYYFTITDAFLREDIEKVFLTLNEIVKLGFDADHFVIGLADHFRDLLIAKLPSTIGILEISDELKKRYFHQASLAKTSFLLSGLHILNQCDIDMVRAKNKRLQVELALGKITYLQRQIQTDLFLTKETEEKKTKVENVEAQNVSKMTSDSPILNQETHDLTTVVDRGTVQNAPETIVQSEAISPKLTPNITGNLDAIRQSILKAEELKASNKKNTTVEDIKKNWAEYTANNPSMSVKSALQLAILDYKDHQVSIKVPTQVSKDMILQETHLFEVIRNEVGVDDLVFDIEVDKMLFPDFEDNKPIVLKSQKERYLHMLEKNQSLGIFTKKFGLKLDTEIS